MPKLNDLESLAIAKCLASQYAQDDTFSLSSFLRQHTTIGITGASTQASDQKIDRMIAKINAHYGALVCGSAHSDMRAYCQRNAKAIMALAYR